MLKDVPPIFRKREPRITARAKAPAQPPVLIAAMYESTTAVTLVFDRAVDASAMDGGAVFVTDGEEQGRLQGDATAETLSPTTVRVTLHFVGASELPGVHLSVAPGNGLVAAGDGTAWAGVSDLALPFGG